MRIRAVQGGRVPTSLRMRGDMEGRRLWKPRPRTAAAPAGCPDATDPGDASLPAWEDLPRLRTDTGRAPDEGSAAQFCLAAAVPGRVRLRVTADRSRATRESGGPP